MILYIPTARNLFWITRFTYSPRSFQELSLTTQKLLWVPLSCLSSFKAISEAVLELQVSENFLHCGCYIPVHWNFSSPAVSTVTPVLSRVLTLLKYLQAVPNNFGQILTASYCCSSDISPTSSPFDHCPLQQSTTSSHHPTLLDRP